MHQVDPVDEPKLRSKRALKSGGSGFFSWFGRKPPATPAVVAPPRATVSIKPPVSPKPQPKPGPSIKPPGGGKPSPTDTFQNLGQAVIHANKVKASDELLMTSLRKQTPSISVAEAAKRLIDADSLVKAGVISSGPKASQVARDAFISAGITGMVSAPVNVAAYAGSVATGEAIKATYTPGVLPPPFLPNAKSATAPAQPETVPPTGVNGTRLEELETKMLGMASTVMFILGDTQSVFTKTDNWPEDDLGRINNLEKLLDTSEPQLKKAARQNGLVFKRYPAEKTTPVDTKERLDLIEKRFDHMAEAYERLRIFAAIKHSEQEEPASVTP